MTPESFWQEVLPADASCASEGFALTAEHTGTEACYPARFDDGRILMLPVRPLPGGRLGLASLIINQASFSVVEALAEVLARKLATFSPDLVIGLPTLGLTLASEVARQLGHRRYVPLGSSAKFWYRDELSVPLSSVTTPGRTKRLYIDPRLLPLLTERRIALIDDVISSGSSMNAAIQLLRRCGLKPDVLGVAMLQSDRGREALAPWPIVTVLHSPIISLP